MKSLRSVRWEIRSWSGFKPMENPESFRVFTMVEGYLATRFHPGSGTGRGEGGHGEIHDFRLKIVDFRMGKRLGALRAGQAQVHGRVGEPGALPRAEIGRPVGALIHHPPSAIRDPRFTIHFDWGSAWESFAPGKRGFMGGPGNPGRCPGLRWVAPLGH